MKKFFLQTLDLARKGQGNVAPNPEVGAIVIRDGKILGQGFHECFGGPHAEVNAIQDAEKHGHDVAGAEIFVSLEPCCHSNKKTPPCTMLLIEKKISAVHIFFSDPNPRVSGRGAKILQSAGVKIFWASKKLQQKHKKFYEIFAYGIQKKTPYCTLKLAQSKNFLLGTQNTQIQISGKESREYTLQERDKHQAILVGSSTILVDNPTLSGNKTEPIRIVLDGSGKIFKNFLSESDVGAPIYRALIAPKGRDKSAPLQEKKLNFFRNKNPKGIPSGFLYITAEENFLQASQKFSKESVIGCPFLPNTKIFDLFALKKILASKNIFSIFIEGGGITAKNFLEQQAVQKFISYQSPLVLPEKNAIVGINPTKISYLKEQQKFFLGDDKITVYKYLSQK